MLLQCRQKYTLITVPNRWSANVLNNYELLGSAVLCQESYRYLVGKSKDDHGTTEEKWLGLSHKFSLGDTVVVPLDNQWVLLLSIGRRRAVLREAANS